LPTGTQAKTIFTSQGYTIDGGELSIAALYSLAFDNVVPDFDAGGAYLVHIARAFAESASQNPDVNVTRTAPKAENTQLMELLRELPFCLGMEYVNLAWIGNIWDSLGEVFNQELSAFDGTVEDYFKAKNNNLNVAGRVFFHLVATKEDDFPFGFMATYSTKKGDTAVHLPLKNALTEFRGDEKALLQLLATVSRAADKSDFITDLTESGELFHALKFQPNESYTFLREVPLYEDCGIICRIPDFWKRKGRSRLSVKLGSEEPSVLGMQELVTFSPSVCLGDVEVTQDELDQLLAQDEGLAYLKGKWVEVDKEKLQELQKQLEVFNSGEYTLAQCLQMLAGVDNAVDVATDDIEVTNGDWLNSVMEKLTEPGKIEAVAPDEEFKALLRHYQQTGLNWLSFMQRLGFGALLADDMGLGKTVQLLALLSKLKDSKTLLIVPASLLVNWRKEAEKFTPKIRIKILHGTDRTVNLDEADLFVTTYGMVGKLEELASITWDLLVLDEAQAIKNAGNKQTKSIKSLTAKTRIAMTGTPIENRLADLWSIFDFLNSGMLGTAKEFSTFTGKLKEHPQGYAKLRSAVSPFILRRLKTDKSVISDLPEKNEIRQFITLSKKQVALYDRLVKELESALRDDQVTGIQRKGRILAAIIKFKQICNHPAQYIGMGEFTPSLSGKFEALAEICETIRDKHESVLVFTQFKEMCEPLRSFLSGVFERDGLMIHGSTTPKKRGETVEKFNSEYVPFMVLSLKAGGVGLNLTAANHVIHFDRWWNPAVENQATDRAFRIGQTRDVMVHKFIASGTIEEKIDVILEGKAKLAGDVIGASAGENWVTEMSNSELLNLFRLEV
jgi:non-specific serine/threonine protein kinase